MHPHLMDHNKKAIMVQFKWRCIFYLIGNLDIIITKEIITKNKRKGTN